MEAGAFGYIRGGSEDEWTMKGQDFRNWDAKGPTALVIGNEGKGISSLLKKKCDEMLTIPMIGHVQSLNASVAASLLIYQGFTSRGK